MFNLSLKTVQKDINNLLMGYMVDGQLQVSKKDRYKLLKQLDKTLLKQAKVMGNKDIEVTTKILNDTAVESYYRTNYLLEAGLDNPLKISKLKENQIKALVNTPIKEEMFGDRIWKNKEKLVKQVRHSVEQALIKGTDPKKLAREVKRIFGVTAYESQRLINNEVARVTRQAQDIAYEQQGVKKVMFDATLDKKTSKFCREHDGKVYNFGDHPKIPEETHVQCRSDIIPIVDGWTPKKKRENIKNEDGVKPVIDYSNYDDWMKHKGFN
ncbi:SPP1 gp7 family putative phage head morphogenesis protein [Neobacillus niacini]|nr:SPP1 gp7 family putative phage head morphogenesis protein [Neobacillus niacini]